MRKYIIFRADQREEQGAEDRLLAHTGAYTEILAEHFDSSNRPLPTLGYRLREFHRIDPFVDPKFPSASTHSRVGDWEVIRVEEYAQQSPNLEFDSIVICYCRYVPVTTPLEPLPQIQVTEQLQSA
jgi:hypothetical protein